MQRVSCSTTTTGYGTATASTTSNCYDPDGNKTATVPGDSNTSGVATCWHLVALPDLVVLPDRLRVRQSW